MIDHTSMARYANALAADVVRGAQHIIAGESEPNEQETLAILQISLMAAAVLEAHAIHALPPDYAKSVRAFVERMADQVQHIINKQSETPIIQVPDDPAPQPPQPDATNTQP